jgi:hypothetical protein
MERIVEFKHKTQQAVYMSFLARQGLCGPCRHKGPL